jgi:ring-1,2-phenylacetyl-CoA epoxidase subunit PaaC
MSSSLIDYTLHLADNALVLGHRNSEWTGHGPILEQDIAISNIALDLIGQSRNLYQYAAELIGNGATEDSLAYFRNADEYKNFLLAEQDNGDWAKTILRQFFFSAYQYLLYQQMQDDERLKAIAEKSLKEVTYHLRWSSEWVIRLGQGTEESHRRMTSAINDLWRYTDEMLASGISDAWHVRVNEILSASGIDIPENVQMVYGGKEGKHTEHLEKLLEEMQYMQRTYPGVEW